MASSSSPASPRTFSVRREKPVLVPPAEPTPHELKRLSDIDDQDGLRFHVPLILLYRHSPSMSMVDPAKLIKSAIGRALAFYYPFAGRLRKGPGGKLSVDCTAEGILFVEADADIRLDDLSAAFHLPFPCLSELLHDVDGPTAVVDSPLLVIQVTRLSCGGFIVAIRLNHAMSDAAGIVQFMTAVGELARGARAPRRAPAWRRELLEARRPPKPTHAHREYDFADEEPPPPPADNMVCRSFFFGAADIAAIRRHVPDHLRASSTTFDILTALLWRSRTAALRPDPAEEVRILCIVNGRSKFSDPPLPAGYYGNVIAYPMAAAPAGELCGRPLGYAVELVKNAKGGVTAEYVRSVADLMVLRGRPRFAERVSYLVSDVRRAAFGEVDFGWGKPVYGGPARGGFRASYYVTVRRDGELEDVIMVAPVWLPAPAMERFVDEIGKYLVGQDSSAREEDGDTAVPFVRSAL